jgi:hypothetical protein
VQEVELLHCLGLLVAGLAAWASLAWSHPTGPAWVLTWLVAPAAALVVVVAAVAASRTRGLPSGRVQFSGFLGLALLCLAAWGWLGVAVPVLGWPAALVAVAVGLPLGLLLVAAVLRVALWMLAPLDRLILTPMDRAKERARVRRWARWNAERDARWKAEREGRPS